MCQYCRIILPPALSQVLSLHGSPLHVWQLRGERLILSETKPTYASAIVNSRHSVQQRSLITSTGSGSSCQYNMPSGFWAMKCSLGWMHKNLLWWNLRLLWAVQIPSAVTCGPHVRKHSPKQHRRSFCVWYVAVTFPTSSMRHFTVKNTDYFFYKCIICL